LTGPKSQCMTSELLKGSTADFGKLRKVNGNLLGETLALKISQANEDKGGSFRPEIPLSQRGTSIEKKGQSRIKQ